MGSVSEGVASNAHCSVLVVCAPIVVDDVALFGARDVYDVAPAVLGAHLVGPGSAVERVLAGTKVRSALPDRAPLPDLNGSFVFP
jgi:hypothetical protein